MACPGLSGVIDHVSSVFRGTRWGVALHCSKFEGGGGGQARGTIQGEEGAVRGG